MKKLLMFLLLGLNISSFLSCDNLVENETTKRKASTLIVEKVSTNSNSISLTAIAEWGSSCGSFSHLVVSQNNKDISITVYGKEPIDAVCLAVMSSFAAPVEIIVDSPGKYNFHFWQTDSTSLDTTITL